MYKITKKHQKSNLQTNRPHQSGALICDKSDSTNTEAWIAKKILVIWYTMMSFVNVLVFSQNRCFQKVIKHTPKQLSKTLPKSLKINKKTIHETVQKTTLKTTRCSSKKWSKMEPRDDPEHVTGTWVRHPWTLQGTKYVPRGPQTPKKHQKVTKRHQNLTKKVVPKLKKSWKNRSNSKRNSNPNSNSNV